MGCDMFMIALTVEHPIEHLVESKGCGDNDEDADDLDLDEGEEMDTDKTGNDVTPLNKDKNPDMTPPPS
jgi:hypothetical protein